MMKRFFLPFLLVGLIFAAGCKKDPVQPDDGRDADKEILLRDSTYYYSLLFSLWEDKLPQPKADSKGDADLKAFTNAFQDAEGVFEALKQYAPEDRFSFVDRAGTVSEEIQQGVHKETGIVPIYISTVDQNNNRETNLYVKYVQKNSPGEKAGFKRGMQIVSINGDSNLDYFKDEKKGIADYYKVVEGKETLNLVVKAYGQETTKTISVLGGAYNIDPILVKNIFTINGKKIGYLFYTSFVNVLGKAGPNAYHTAMTNTFKEFENAQVDELIVDLRYNGGGSTATAELLANLIVPTAGAKGKMYDYKVNKNLEKAGWVDNNDPEAPFRSVNFNKTNALNIPRVYFLGTEGTASASELVMNVLKPYMDVQIITTNGKGTYGKPVGFFGWPTVQGYADLYITSFQMINKDGFGDYFNGLKGKISDASDGFFTELGNQNEALLSTALDDITGQGTGARASTRTVRGNRELEVKMPEIKEYRNNMYKFSDQKIPTLPLKD